ncbi:MAG: PKD domain-containing protein [Planctomycetes bacterium]|nr:PKD domain-containing protein [Planctomycetota bacterium]
MSRVLMFGVCAAAVLALTGTAAAESATYQVAASADDTRADSSNNYYNFASVYWPCSSASTMGYLRWAIDIPAGATIDSAYLEVYVTSTYSTASTVQMQLLDYDNCPAFSSNPYSWSVTGSPVSWTQSSWTANSWNSSATDSVDLKTIVQAFIDRGGYSSGNYLGLRGVWTSGALRYIRAWDDSLTPLHTYGAKLVVTYTSGGATNDPPVADAGSNQNVTDTDDSGYETVTLDGTGSSDSDGTIVSYIWKEGATQIATGSTANVSLSVGTHTITLVVTDDDSDTDDDTCQVVVNPVPSNEPPVANAGSNQNVTDTDDNGYETVTLDGTGSSDSDGTIVSYVWKEGASQIATGQTANVSLSVGTHTITLVVTDDDSDSDDDTCQIVVNECTGPTEETYQVAASTDDTRADSSTNYVSWGNLVWPASSSAMRSYIRWAIDVPYGATIESAYVQVYTTSSYSTAGTVQMQLLDFDNCPDFGTNPFTWSVTGDTVNWTLGSWTANNWYTSEDVTDIVQGFVDRAGYAPGNYLGLRAAWVSGSQRYVRSFDDTPGHTTGAKLVVTYSGGDAGPATYYIDYDGGNDANDGRSSEDAWQHCPGDPEATGVPAARETLWPGDTLLFKGGVVYRGTVVCNWAGSEAAPIIYDGNSEGTYGTGKAVIDGSEEIAGWTQCTSSGDAEGNSNWANLWYNYLPAGTSALGCNIYEDDTMCPPAQDPNPPDAAFPDCIGGVSTPNYYYITYTDLTKTSVTDPTNLNRGGDSTYWHDAIVAAHYSPNVVYTMTIQGYNTSTGTVSFNDSNNGTCYTDSNQSCYAIFNSLHVLDQSGEVFFRTTPEGDGTHKVWFWSPSGSPNSHTVTYSTRTAGFQVASGSDYLAIQNFIVQKQTGDTGVSEAMGLRATDGSVSHLAILDCEFRRIRFNGIDSNQYRGNGAVTISAAGDVVFDGNTVTETPFLGGMVMGDGDGITITNNYFYRCGNKPIWWPACNASDITIAHNVLDNNRGCHSTAISLFGIAYEDGQRISDAVVAYNIVSASSNCFTYSAAEDIVVAYNLFDSGPLNHYSVQDNGASHDRPSAVTFHNNIFIRPDNAPSLAIGFDVCTLKNNISYCFAGSASLTPDADSNLYIKHDWDTTVFADPANGDYHLASGSPARDAGQDLGYEEDLDGVEVPQNDDPDIGCYEYAP